MNLREDFMKYDHSVVFICHAAVEIWGFRYRRKLCIGTLKIMASTSVFELVVCALKHSKSEDGGQKE
jgi:hypothetical protein